MIPEIIGGKNERLAANRAQHGEHVFEFLDELANYCRALIRVAEVILDHELVTSSANGKPLDVKQASDLTDQHHVMTLIIPAISTAFDGLELRELLLPVAKNMGLHPT